MLATQRESVTTVFFGLSWSFNASGYALLAMIGGGAFVLVNLAWVSQVFRPSYKFAELKSEMEQMRNTLASNDSLSALQPASARIANAERIEAMSRKLQKLRIPHPDRLADEPEWHRYLSGLIVLAEERDLRKARVFWLFTEHRRSARQ